MSREQQFLYSGEAGQYLTAIQSLIKKSNRIYIAVAFWGQGAIEKLKLPKKDIKKDVRIVCSLKNGISNPGVIQKLRDIYGDNVKQYHNLHAKIFLFDKEVVVGSANVSTFGLPSTEAEEENGWMEAGVRLNDPGTVGEIETWFNKIWNDAQVITDDDIEKAKKYRSLYRQLTLFETLEKCPDFFDNNWRMAISSEYLSDTQNKEAVKEYEKRGKTMDDKRFSAYGNWGARGGMREKMKIMDFFVKVMPKSSGYKVTYGGIWHIDEEIPKEKLHLTHYCPDFPESKEPKDEWKRFINFIIAEKASDKPNPDLLLKADEVIELLKQYKEEKLR